LVLALGKLCKTTNFLNPSKTSYNIDRYPGLGYYNIAASIMGELYGERTLTAAYAYILASLYWGQIGRVILSASYIIHAANIVSELRMCYDKEITVDSSFIRTMSHSANQLCIAFYSCLQLESDIRAEYEWLSHSRLTGLIERHNKVVCLPGFYETPLKLFDGNLDVSKVGFHFLAQISIRRILNRAHMSLYREPMDGKATYKAKDLWKSLQSWRDELPLILRWQDSNHLSTDILIARLRAKYYGAAHIISRPSLYANLEYDRITVVKLEGLDTLFTGDTLEDELKACQRCIAAALNSTTALDGLAPEPGMLKRPRTSNLHGTVTA
jgi:hypothetical protein